MSQDSVPAGSYNDPFLSSVCVSDMCLCVCVFSLASAVCPFGLHVETHKCCMRCPKLKYQRDSLNLFQGFASLCTMIFFSSTRTCQGLIWESLFRFSRTVLSLGRSGRSPDCTSNSFTTCSEGVRTLSQKSQSFSSRSLGTSRAPVALLLRLHMLGGPDSPGTIDDKLLNVYWQI